MTTAGNNGVPESPEGGAPQDDDPFGYLYRPAEGASAQPAEPQQGVPRTSYNRPMEVGRAQYGQQARPQQPYPPQQQPYPQGGQGGQPYGQQPEHGGAMPPTQQTRYAEHSRPQPGEERPSGGRGKGAVIGAVAVVAAIAIGAGIALSTGDPDDKKAKGGTSSAAPVVPSSGSGSPSASASATSSASATAAGPGTYDATQLQGQNAPSGNTVKGAKSADGGYLTLQPGGSVTWAGEVSAAGTYKLTVHFNNPATDVKAAATVNGKDWPSGLTFKNYSPGKDAAASWYTTFILPQLQAGPNTITISGPSGGTVLIDQVVLEAA
ncbi:carbohydrate-binding protein [Kitasatospora sp. NPDC058170]|uniref:carbohydrate-binding protein n=1 Tax=Kitasatospora sp. NPDC058170 TaxID=3346364 RepID=UPI0036D8B5DC